MPVDLDKDGTVDGWAQDTDGDGQADKNANGDPVMVPGTLIAVDQMAQLDEMSADTTEIVMGLFGLGAIGTTIGTWIRKNQLAKRAAYWMTASEDIITSVEAAKKDMGVKSLAAFKEKLADYQSPDTVTAVKVAKGELPESSVVI